MSKHWDDEPTPFNKNDTRLSVEGRILPFWSCEPHRKYNMPKDMGCPDCKKSEG